MFIVNVANVVFPYTTAQAIIIQIFAQISMIQTTNAILAFVSTFLMFRFLTSSDKQLVARLLGKGRT